MQYAIAIPSYNRPSIGDTVDKQFCEIYDDVLKHRSRIYVLNSGDKGDILWREFHPKDSVRRCSAKERINVGLGRNILIGAIMKSVRYFDYIVLCDDDIIVPSSTIHQCIDFLEKHKGQYGMVSPYGVGGVQYEMELRKHSVGYHIDINCPWRCVVVARSVAETIGYHDPNITFRDDHDYAIRARLHSYKSAIVMTDKIKQLADVQKSGGYAAYAKEARQKRLYESAVQLKQKYPFLGLTSNGRIMCTKQLEQFRKSSGNTRSYRNGLYIDTVYSTTDRAYRFLPDILT